VLQQQQPTYPAGSGQAQKTAAAAGERSHPAIAAAQQLHQQQQQLAGIAAAIAAGGYGGSSGPLQAPLLAQLQELSGKVRNACAVQKGCRDQGPKRNVALPQTAGSWS
jgi:hypothetical protein